MINIGFASYLTGGVAFTALTILLLTSWRGRSQGGLLSIASAATAAWNLLLAAASVSTLPVTIVFVAEVLRDAAWFGFLLNLLASLGPRALPRYVKFTVHALWAVALCYVVAMWFLGAQGSVNARDSFIVEPLFLSLAGIVLIEQLYRNVLPDQRWAVKHLCLGLGALFTYDLFLYSYSLLYRHLALELWAARGVVGAFAVPLIAVSAARNPEWSVEVAVSRRIAFYTTSLMAAGLYLIAMSIGGYYVRIYGGSWGAFGEIVFVVAAISGLIVIALSGQVRSRLWVFVSKHFFNYKYDYREEWLRLIASLSKGDDDGPLPVRAVKAMAQLVESPGGALWLNREKRFVPVADWNYVPPGAAVESEDGSLGMFLRQRGWIIELSEYRQHPSRYNDLALPNWLERLPRAWLTIPLMTQHGVLGFIVLAQPRAPIHLGWEVRDLLKTAGREIGGYLAQQEAAQALSEAKQFDAYNRLTAFVMHDLKNLIAQQSLVVKNAAKHKGNPAFFDDAINTIDNSVRRMSRLLEQLKRGDVSGVVKRVRMADAVRQAVEQCRERQPVPEVRLDIQDEEIHAEPERLIMILGHIVRNAQEATPADGHVLVRGTREGSYLKIDIEDNGEGMDPDFIRNRLFQPFYTTKSTKGMGIGAYQTREFARSLGGDVSVVSKPGQGTLFTILLPVAASSSKPIDRAATYE